MTLEILQKEMIMAMKNKDKERKDTISSLVQAVKKFGIDNIVLDSKNYNDYFRRGLNPFAQKKIVICSYNFAARKQNEIKLHGFDLAVIDEAHKLPDIASAFFGTEFSCACGFGTVYKVFFLVGNLPHIAAFV